MKWKTADQVGLLQLRLDGMPARPSNASGRREAAVRPIGKQSELVSGRRSGDLALPCLTARAASSLVASVAMKGALQKAARMP